MTFASVRSRLASPNQPIRITLSGRRIALYALVNVFGLLPVLSGTGIDWAVLAESPGAFLSGNLYAPAPVPYAWSPLFPWVIFPAIPFGFAGWVALHFAALALLRHPTLILLAVLSGGFYADVNYGNTVTFMFVAGVLALGGSGPAAIAYVILFTLIPRPLAVPLLFWLLWTRPGLRWPATAILIVSGILVAATGYMGDWVASVMDTASNAGPSDINWGPARYLGLTWFVAAVPAAALLLRRGFIGLPSLLVSPYIYPQYLLFLLIDLHELRVERLTALRRPRTRAPR